MEKEGGGRAFIVLALYCLKQGEKAKGGIGLYHIAQFARKCWLIRRQGIRSEYKVWSCPSFYST
jgi:hypothetical protein